MSIQSEIKGSVLSNERLAKYTSWRVGGLADRLFKPENREDLLVFLSHHDVNEPLFWIGLGSNLLIRDGGIRGTVIYTRGQLKRMLLNDDGTIMVEAGVPCAHVARFCAEQGLTGAEFLAGIPGTMGGALKMNAGAFNGETWRIVASVEMVNTLGEVITRDVQQFKVSYRSVQAPMATDEWFLSARLKLAPGNTQQSQQKVKALLAKRSQTQPTNLPTCGSVFKNPPDDYAARLIEQSSLKGYELGGARVSEKHANFIVNTGKASATDIENLIIYVAAEVERLKGVQLHTEVCIVGEKL